ncbi:MAG TPA: nucleotide exchange factor GrpE [Polyangiaceae bacterium]
MHDDSNRNAAREAEAAARDGEGDAGDPAEALPEPSAPAASEDPLSAAQAEASRLKDQWLRTAADFDNFRKRTRKELEDARRTGREDLLRAVLPVFDNLERAIQSAQRSTDVKAVADGLSLVQRQFTESLGREGIARVPTVGQPFDPAVHEAIQQVETEDHAPGTVLAEVQPGYVQGERLVRAAMVVVAKPKGADREPGSGRAAS